jgi:nucleosome binding factor SPN SPT16 subunit
MLLLLLPLWLQVLREKAPELAERMPKNVGFGMGLEFRESGNVLNAKNTQKVKAGNIFNVCIGIAGLENPAATDSRGQVYALQVGLGDLGGFSAWSKP